MAARRARQRAKNAGAGFGGVCVVLAPVLLAPVLAVIVYGVPVVIALWMIGRWRGGRAACLGYGAVLMTMLAVAPAWCRELSAFIAAHILYPMPRLGMLYGAMVTASLGGVASGVAARWLGGLTSWYAEYAEANPGSTETSRGEPEAEAPTPPPMDAVTAPSWCSILGVPESADPGEIKAAYRRQAMRWHPDRVGATRPGAVKQAERRMRAINQAYAESKRSS